MGILLLENRTRWGVTPEPFLCDRCCSQNLWGDHLAESHKARCNYIVSLDPAAMSPCCGSCLPTVGGAGKGENKEGKDLTHQ